jgi:hypothetical protein
MSGDGMKVQEKRVCAARGSFALPERKAKNLTLSASVVPPLKPRDK